MRKLAALFATIGKEWKSAENIYQYLFRLFGDAMKGAALAWIAHITGNSALLSYIIIGIPFIAMWHGIVAIGGWSLTRELTGKTLDFTLVSKVSLGETLFAQTLGQTLREIPSGVVALGAAILVSRQVPQVANLPLIFVSVFLTLVGLAATGYFFSALVTMVEGRAGFFMGMIPFGAVLSSLVMPVDQLPRGLSFLAKCFPASWAMSGVWTCINESNFEWKLLLTWGIFLLVTLCWLIGTYQLCKVVESRIRIKGNMSGF